MNKLGIAVAAGLTVLSLSTCKEKIHDGNNFENISNCHELAIEQSFFRKKILFFFSKQTQYFSSRKQQEILQDCEAQIHALLNEDDS